jgi:hypothetical protein
MPAQKHIICREIVIPASEPESRIREKSKAYGFRLSAALFPE